MSEERRMILEMLSEKKITAEEAAELLRAIGPIGPAVPPTEPARSDSPGGSASGKSILEDFLGRLDIDWGSLPFAFGGEAYRFDEEHRGEFAAGEPVNIDFAARNGRVEVFGSKEPGWRVVIRKKIRAQDEGKARKRAAEIASFRSGPGSLHFEEHATGGSNSGVSIEAHVPFDRVSMVLARSSNGRVVIENLLAREIRGKTANGKVLVRGVTADVADLATANGGITYEGGCSRLECSTANGTITVCPRPEQGEMSCKLHTSNGSIRVSVPRDAGIGYRVDARTGHGALSVALPAFDVRQEEKQFGRRLLRGQSSGYADRQLRVDITARTTNGGIKVGQLDTGEGTSDACGEERDSDHG